MLDGKLSYSSLKDRLKEITTRVRTRIREEVDSEVDDIESELSREIESDLGGDFDDEDFTPSEEFMDSPDDDDDVEEFDEGEGIVSITAIKTRVAFLNDNLPEFANKISTMEMNDSIIEIAKALDKLYENIDNLLAKIEEKSR